MITVHPTIVDNICVSVECTGRLLQQFAGPPLHGEREGDGEGRRRVPLQGIYTPTNQSHLSSNLSIIHVSFLLIIQPITALVLSINQSQHSIYLSTNPNTRSIYQPIPTLVLSINKSQYSFHWSINHSTRIILSINQSHHLFHLSINHSTLSIFQWITYQPITALVLSINQSFTAVGVSINQSQRSVHLWTNPSCRLMYQYFNCSIIHIFHCTNQPQQQVFHLLH